MLLGDKTVKLALNVMLMIGVINVHASFAQNAGAIHSIKTHTEQVAQEKEDADSTGNDYSKYEVFATSLRQRVRSCWFPPKVVLPVAVAFTVNKDGQISNLKIEKTTDTISMKAVDTATLRAVRIAAPFKYFPQDGPDRIFVSLRFYYRMPSNYDELPIQVILRFKGKMTTNEIITYEDPSPERPSRRIFEEINRQP